MIMFLVWAAALIIGGAAAWAVSETFSMPISIIIVVSYSYLVGIGVRAVREMLQ